MIRPGDRLVLESGGGGGWGDPARRDPAAVARDVESGFVTSRRSRQTPLPHCAPPEAREVRGIPSPAFGQGARPAMYRIGIDVGGTFTDLVAIDEAGATMLAKVPSTPEDPSLGVLDGLARLAQRLGLERAALLGATPTASSTAPRSRPTRCSNARAREQAS